MRTINEIIDAVLVQVENEEKYNKNQMVPRLYQYFRKEDESLQAWLSENKDIPEDLMLRVCVNLAIHKRIDISAWVGMFYRKFDGDIENILAFTEYLMDKQVLDWDPESSEVYSSVIFIPHELDDAIYRWQYPLPLICEPRKIYTNIQSCYYTVPRESVVLNQVDPKGDINLDHINRVNSVKYRLNIPVLETVDNVWDGKGHKDPWQKARNFNRYMSIAEDHIKLLAKFDCPFSLGHAYDGRLRTYCKGWTINEQGNDWNKNSLLLANTEVVRKYALEGEQFTPLEYMKIDIATAFGKDKLTWDKRLEWFDTHYSKLNWKKADEPARAFNLLYNYALALKGKSIGAMVAMDATNSGMQMLSILLGSYNGALLTNAINSGERVDGYTVIYELTLKKYAELSEGQSGSLPELTRQQIKDAVMQYFYGGTKTPKDYLGEEGFMAFEAALIEVVPELVHFRNFMLESWDPTAAAYDWIMPDNGHCHCPVRETSYFNFMFKGNYYTTGVKLQGPAPRGKANGANLTHSVDGFILREVVARCMYSPEHVERIRKAWRKVQNSQYKVKKMSKKTLKKSQKVKTLLELGNKSGYYSVRLLDYLTPSNIYLVPEPVMNMILDSLPAEPFDIMTVHDCFYTHPNHIDDVRKQYRFCLAQLSQSNMLQFILDQMLPNQKGIKVDKLYDLTDEVTKEEYAIC